MATVYVYSSPSTPSAIPPLLHSQKLAIKSNGLSSIRATVKRSKYHQFQICRRFGGRPRYSNSGCSLRTGARSNSESTGAPTSVPVRVAHELLQAGHRYLDVRTPDEFSAGHVPGAINIPYMFKLGSGMTKNPNFLEDVSSHFGKDDEIVVGCQIGKRSLMAATDLLSTGYTGITDMAGGYTAWMQNGLPTEP
ncbi:hypothetical protein Nepgr_008431 [Nepenthes gracilis]|uniref:Rhodanese domain-containing protein n=1 Tax=Nepenthes gracilis TaxID=150966 RepID=A0AAD3S9Q2_NEPGR|nr:hypothetical protein Nepgr_008431 [Nepenthes gracilis]